jgi:hypothetical protein
MVLQIFCEKEIIEKFGDTGFTWIAGFSIHGPKIKKRKLLY